MKSYIDLSSEPHDVKTSPHGNRTPVPLLGTRLGGQLTSVGRFGEQKKHLVLQQIEPQFLGLPPPGLVLYQHITQETRNNMQSRKIQKAQPIYSVT